MNNAAVIEKSSYIKSPHGFSTRLGGVSTGVYSSLNLGMNRKDEPEAVTQNWKLFLDKCDIGYRPFVCGKQVHDNYVHIAKETDAALPFERKEELEADGYVTATAGLPLVIFTADCVPVILEDIKAKVVGAVHCGWRSTVADIEKNVIDAMVELGADTKNISIAVGPAIDRCCFEVGSEVIEAVDALIGKENSYEFYNQKENGKYMLDLRGVVKARFMQLGVSVNNIENVGGCTLCNPDRYYSHRYSEGLRGSLASTVMLRQ